MIWDPCLARAVAAELRARLQGARARAVRLRREARVVLVHFRDATVEVDLSPRRGTVVVGLPTEPGEGAEPLPAVLAGVEAVRDERVIVMRFRRVRGRKPNPGLILELATNRWNAILAEGPELRVRKRLRIVRSRPLPVGQPWAAPGDGRAAGTREIVDLERWRELMVASAAGPRAVLLPRIAYLSGLNVGHVLGTLGPGEPPGSGGAAGSEAATGPEATAGSEAVADSGAAAGSEAAADPDVPPDPEAGFRRWRAMVEMTGVHPHLLRLASGLQPYPWPLDGADAEPVGSLLEGMQRVREASGADSTSVGSQVAKRMTAEARRLTRKLKHLRRQMEKTEQAGELREDGALILSSLHLIEPGTAEVTLAGFDGVTRTLRLDPLQRPQDHANALFRRAARLDRAAAELPGRIEATEQALADLTALRTRHARGELTAKEAESLLPPPRAEGTRSSRPGDAPAPLPYRVFTSSGGLQIRVGRGARHNDDLTFHHSRPADIWLHARHAAGAHVILRWAGPERPPARDLEEAAILAATYSGARGSAHVPVDWTRRKWVRKPKGAAPGAVIPDRVQTLFVAPDASIGERLGG